MVKGMKKVSKDMKGWWAQSLSRRRGLGKVSATIVCGEVWLTKADGRASTDAQ